MNGHLRRVGAALLAALVLLGSPAWARGGTDFCDLIDAGRLSVTVIEVGDGVILTFSATGRVDLVREQVHRLAERAQTGLDEGVVPAQRRGDWTLPVPASAALAIDRLTGAILFMTDSEPARIQAIKTWGIRVQHLLVESRCDELLIPPGQV